MFENKRGTKMITKARIYVLNKEANEFQLDRAIPLNGALTADTIERYAYVLLANALRKRYPGQWCYRYGKLVEGVTVATPGTLESKYSAGGVDGVTDLSLIADGGFTGQFQWIDGGLGGRVPGYVETDDAERDARSAAKQEAYRREEQRKADALKEKLATLEPMHFSDGGAELWQSWIDANQDGYGSACVHYAEYWARLMQAKFVDGYTPEYLAEIAENTGHEADVEGIIGFMYGAAVSMLADAWVYGDDLRRWHNKEWGAPDAKGTVNPALLTINTD